MSFVFVVSVMHSHYVFKDFLPVRVISFETLSIASTASAPSSQASTKNFSGVVCLGENKENVKDFFLQGYNYSMEMFSRVHQTSQCATDWDANVLLQNCGLFLGEFLSAFKIPSMTLKTSYTDVPTMDNAVVQLCSYAV